MMRDAQYLERKFSISELEHSYGKNVHLISDPYYDRLLARFSVPETLQPEANVYVADLAKFLLTRAVGYLFPREKQIIKTRMRSFHAEAEFEMELLSTQTQTVVVDLMRAGILPSQVCFEALHRILPPSQIRQDHILINRKSDRTGRVVGTQLSGFKIGGSVEGAYVFFPDPMGATGSTLDAVMDLYEKEYGKPRKFIALHFIVTPEYLKRLESRSESLEIFAFRLDRGLSEEEVLNSELGKFWDRERGLNDSDYIVPGAGGIGEILNNSFV